MNEFSLILKDITMIFSNESIKVKGMNTQKTVRHFWQTHGVGDQLKNIQEILTNQYGRGSFHDTPRELVEFTTNYKKIKITIFHTRPNKYGTQVQMTKKNLHHFFNGKPVDILLPFKQIYYDLYQRFKVKKGTVLPFVAMIFETTDLSSYEIRVLHDTRYIQFTPVDEGMLIRKLQGELTQQFKELYAQSIKGENDVEPEDYVDEEIVGTKKARALALQNVEEPRLRESKFKDKV
jgi:hypothetical protein